MRNIVNIAGLAVSLLAVSGCVPLPFFTAESETKQFVQKEEQKAAAIKKNTVPNIRKVKPYEDYNYQVELHDPFALKDFIEVKDPEEEKVFNPYQDCPKSRCSENAPEPHIKEILENYDLNALRLVGILDKKAETVALIETPDVGILEARVGNYIGKDNGKIIKIEESGVIILEKKKQGTLWRDQKKILVINK